MVRTIVHLRETQVAALERVARRRGVSKAAVIREALDDLLTRESGDEALNHALAAAGSGGSGLSDLGERQDDYLADRGGE